jgi:hypothetical protein
MNIYQKVMAAQITPPHSCECENARSGVNSAIELMSTEKG